MTSPSQAKTLRDGEYVDIPVVVVVAVGDGGGGTETQKYMCENELFAHAVKLDPSHAQAWNALAVMVRYIRVFVCNQSRS